MIKATLILLIAGCVIPRLRQRSAAERHLLWAVSLGAAGLLPLLNLVLPSWQPGWARQVLSATSFVTGQTWSAGHEADIIVRATGIEATTWTVDPLLSLLWASGTVLLMLMLAAEALRLSRLAFAARQAVDRRSHQLASEVARALHLNRPIRLLLSSRGTMPVTWGVRRPRVMLPACAAGWSDDRTRAVLAHELAHIRRNDWLLHVLAELGCAVYWFHPLFWLAKSRLCRESEHAADDVVLGLGVDGTSYATDLLEIVRAARKPVRPWSPTIAMARPSHLERRFAALLMTCANRGGVTRRKAVAAVAIAILVVLPLAAMSLREMNTNITIRTTDLPPMAETATSSSRARAVAAVRQVRVVGLRDTADAVTRPEIVEYTTPPLYSDEARKRGVEGIVTVGARVEKDGRVSAVFVVKGLGFGLDQNALVALRQWRFLPGTRAGEPIAIDTQIDVEFSLRNEAVNALIANDMATRVGPGVTPPRAVRVFGLWPRRPKIRGTVVLDVVLLENGTPKIVRILQSLAPELDESAIRNFEQWRFSPAMKDGRAVKVRLNAEVSFHE